MYKSIHSVSVLFAVVVYVCMCVCVFVYKTNCLLLSQMGGGNKCGIPKRDYMIYVERSFDLVTWGKRGKTQIAQNLKVN